MGGSKKECLEVNVKVEGTVVAGDDFIKREDAVSSNVVEYTVRDQDIIDLFRAATVCCRFVEAMAQGEWVV